MFHDFIKNSSNIKVFFVFKSSGNRKKNAKGGISEELNTSTRPRAEALFSF